MLVTIVGNKNLSKNFTVQHTVAKQLNIKKVRCFEKNVHRENNNLVKYTKKVIK